jgi:hypothetical protein
MKMAHQRLARKQWLRKLETIDQLHRARSYKQQQRICWKKLTLPQQHLPNMPSAESEENRRMLNRRR